MTETYLKNATATTFNVNLKKKDENFKIKIEKIMDEKNLVKKISKTTHWRFLKQDVLPLYFCKISPLKQDERETNTPHCFDITQLLTILH